MINPEGLMENSGGRGLPEKLPAGEHVLWQGSPSWKTLYRRAFHARPLAIYFAVLLVWCEGSYILHGGAPLAVLLSTLKLGGLSLIPLALLALYAWGVQRSAIYTVTNRRVVMSIGLVVPMSINLPFSKIASAGLHRNPDGSGDIAIQTIAGETVSYAVLWPHARPWRMGKPEPMFRCIPDAEAAAAILARALASHAAGPVVLRVVEASRPVEAEISGRAAQAA